jgi:PAS domain S-box-containing protein
MSNNNAPSDTPPSASDVSVEIAHRQRAERALLESQARQDAITSAMPDLVFLLDEDGRYLEILAAADDLLLAEQSKLLGKTMHEVMTEEAADRFLRVVHETLDSGSSRTIEYSLPVQKGDIFFEGRTAPVSELVQDKRAVVFVARDISDRKAIEAQLLKAKEEAELANRAKSDFLASMSHQLRTPLNAVLGFAQILQSDTKNPVTPNQAKQLGHIRDGGNHLLELINQVLDLSKIESDQFDLNPEVLDTWSVVHECMELIAPLGEPSGITMLISMDTSESVTLYADHLRLKQALINLLSNAVKYNRPDGTVTIEGRQASSNFYCISVNDTGIGIAAENHPDVFKMFNRLGTAASIAQEGTGIGLYVTKLLIEKMGGRIGFTSREGIGSTFWIEIPITRQVAPPARKQTRIRTY